MNKRNAEFMISENISRYAEYKSFRKDTQEESFQKAFYCYTIINRYYEKKSVPLIEGKEMPHLIPSPAGENILEWEHVEMKRTAW